MRSLVRDIKIKIKHKQNFMMVFVGDCGSGKSLAGVEMAMLLDDTFTPEERVVFTPQQFVDVIEGDKLQPGSAIIWDESGVGHDSRNFQSSLNKLITHTVQTFRFKRLIVIFTVPNLSFIDKKTRSLFDVIVDMQGVNVEKKTSVGRWYYVSTNKRSGKIYYKRPIVKDDKGRKVRLDFIRFPRPDIKTVHRYEKMKAAYCNELYTTIKHEMNPNKDEEEKMTMTEMAEQLIPDIQQYLDRKGRIITPMVQDKYDIGRIKAEGVRRIAEKLLS